MENFYTFLNNAWQLLLEYKTSVLLILFAISVEIIARRIKTKNKKIILEANSESTDQENNEFYLQYYKKNQAIDFLRVITSIFLASSLFVIHTDIGLGFFSVAAGAIIISFKDFILSVLAFFFVTPSYPIGTTIRVGWVQGQIIFIRMLSIGILGKDDRWEATGEMFLVPSHKFLTDVVNKKEIHSNSLFKDYIEIPYAPEKFTHNFDDFLAELRTFLQDIFPLRNANNVGNFSSYTWHRYKLNFSYHEDTHIAIQIRFLWTSKQNAKYKEQIVSFADKYYKREWGIIENTEIWEKS